MIRTNRLTFVFCLLVAGIISACTTAPVIVRDDIAQRIAAPAQMVERTIAADPFLLTAYERVRLQNGPADLYIEGDGEAWETRLSQSLDPTPANPVALHLASRDSAENVFYLARPCQYSGMLDPAQKCDAAYWGDKRFAPEVIEAYQLALDDIKARYGITKFNVIGFSGGGAIAAILAAQRDDVVSLRTVAGNLDNRTLSAHHNVSYMDGSLNPPDFAAKLASIPQYHFIGDQDTVIPPSVLDSYLQALGSDSCSQYMVVKNADHNVGWVNIWPNLLDLMPTCDKASAAVRPAFEPVMPYDGPGMEPIYNSPETPEKP
ncbi:MAG: hypothetical protein KDJ35_09610 [Alphaproteobacteria bacterium]|nr:hypothetical protein [Alphaproteobacteria bacterium]